MGKFHLSRAFFKPCQMNSKSFPAWIFVNVVLRAWNRLAWAIFSSNFYCTIWASLNWRLNWLDWSKPAPSDFERNWTIFTNTILFAKFEKMDPDQILFISVPHLKVAGLPLKFSKIELSSSFYTDFGNWTDRKAHI